MNKVGEIFLLLFIICMSAAVRGDDKDIVPAPKIVEVTQTVLQVPLKKGVTPQAAVVAMIEKAGELNVKVISRLQIYKVLRKKGIETGHLEVLQLCNPEDAGGAVKLNPIFAAYIPCRIALVEDSNGIVWAMLQNVDFLVDNQLMPPDVVEFAIRINQTMLAILTAGVNGGL